MPVGRRRSVCTSHSCRSFLLTVSPAPPSNRTLSGTTTAARPFCFKRVFTCWMKLSCLLDVVAQKSSRSMISVSRDTLPFSATMVVLLFLPKGGLVRTISNRSPGSDERVRNDDRKVLVRPDAVEHQVHGAKPGS